ncbi:MAG: hypothetical protein U5J96_17265 [Ignavibacteriaceae bacterium]|nr:hypothetical protein [Ignavibacteriaceae bacterium]
MENDFGAAGAAADLSFDMLKSCSCYRAELDQPKIAFRICTDAYKLPLKAIGFRSVFCYSDTASFS